MMMIKHILLALACAWALLGTGGASAQNLKADYQPATVSGYSQDVKANYAPERLQSVNLDTPYAVKRIEFEVFNDPHGKLKFFLPPGTVGFTGNLYFYYYSQEAKGVLRLHTPPSDASRAGITSQTPQPRTDETVLRNLLYGQEVSYYSSGAPASSMVLSSPMNPLDPLPQGGYVYSNFQYPGGMLQRGLWHVFVRSDCYEQWFHSSSTRWGADGHPDENAVHTCEGSGPSEPPEPPEPPVPDAASVIATPHIEADGTATLRLTLALPPHEVAESLGTSSYWLAARIPREALPGLSEDLWLFRTPAGWAPLESAVLSFVALRTGMWATTHHSFDVPIGFTQADLAALQVEFHFAYGLIGEDFRYLGKVWGAAD